MKKYIYEGPVTEFGKCIDNNWRCETMAVSPSKAKSNLKFKYKKLTGRMPSAKIDLPGKLTIEE